MSGDGEFERKLSTLEMSEIFGVSPPTIWRWATREGGIPHIKTWGKQLKYLASEVVPYLIENGRDVPPELARLAKGRPSPQSVSDQAPETVEMELSDVS